MGSQWFSESERVEMSIPVIRRIKTAIKKGDTAKAIDLCEDLKEERIILHDFFTDCLAAIFTWISENLGEDKLSDMFTNCFENSSRRPVYDLLGIDIDRGLEAELLVRGWVAHSCSGAGEHPAAFWVPAGADLQDAHRTGQNTAATEPGELWQYLPDNRL